MKSGELISLRASYCPAGSLAWASDQAGLAGSSPTHMGYAGPNPKKIVYA
jgi:hypothetical protein